MEELFDPMNSRLSPERDRFALVGSRIPEEKFIYEIRSRYAESDLPTAEELILISDDFEVDIWPLEAWARRGNSVEHRACLELCRRAEAFLSKKYLLEEIASMSRVDIDRKHLGSLEYELLRSIRNRIENENQREDQASYQELIEREASARQSRLASMTPEQIEAEQINARLIDLSMSLTSAINDNNAQHALLLVNRCEEFIVQIPGHFGESRTLNSLNEAIARAKSEFSM